MKKISDAISDLSKLFKVGDGLSILIGYRFHICKWEFPREEVRRILSEYFLSHTLEPGWKLVLDPIEYIYTEFYLTNEQ